MIVSECTVHLTRPASYGLVNKYRYPAVHILGLCRKRWGSSADHWVIAFECDCSTREMPTYNTVFEKKIRTVLRISFFPDTKTVLLRNLNTVAQWLGLGWVGSGHGKWTHGQLWTSLSMNGKFIGN